MQCPDYDVEELLELKYIEFGELKEKKSKLVKISEQKDPISGVS